MPNVSSEKVPSPIGAADWKWRSEIVVPEPDGSYRGWIIVRYLIPEVGAALATAGFKPSSEGLMLSVDGRL